MNDSKVKKCVGFNGQALTASWVSNPIGHVVIRDALTGKKLKEPIMSEEQANDWFATL